MPGRVLAIPKGWRLALALVLVAVPLIWLFRYDPAAAAGRYPVCPFFGFTGLYCPGCGTLRALHRLLHLKLGGALGFNPLTVVCVAVFAVDAGLRRFAGERRAALLGKQQVQRAVKLIPLAVCLFWILRNLPVAPFRMLAPH